MALFGGQRDAKFLAAINSELLNAVIDTELEKKRKQYEFEIIHKNYQLAIRVIKKL